MSRFLPRWMLVLLLLLVVIPLADARSAPVGKLMEGAPSMAKRDSPGPGVHGLLDVSKVSGDYKLLAMLVEFTDIKHETSRDSIHDMIFERMNQYWNEVSYGQLNVIGDTVGWINMGHDEGYYGKDTNPLKPGSDQRDAQLFADACMRVRDVDFSQYQDIMVIYAGIGQESDQKNTNLLWSSASTTGLDVACGNKRFDHGASASEITEGGILDLGAFTHEFGHTIGLPDLYHLAMGSQADDFVGLWSLMAAGSWGGPNDDGSSPTGLESWSRIKLGWISSTPVLVTSNPTVQTLNQLGNRTDTRTLKVATKGSGYYLAEVRERTGVDEYLPDSGVLITRIDEARRSGMGIVRVMDCHPETETIDDATCKLNDSWEDESNGIYLRVIGNQGANYVIAIASKPISIAQVAVSIEPNMPGAGVKVDGVLYDSQLLPAAFIWNVGSQHVLELQSMIEDNPETRHLFVGWSDGVTTTERAISVSYSASYTAKFKIQYLLTVQSVTGDPRGSGWYDAGSTATFSVISPSPLEGFMGLLGGKYIFDHWSGDSTANAATASVVMNDPKEVRAEWHVDNTLPYIIVSGIIAAFIVAIALLILTKHRKVKSLSTSKQQPSEAPAKKLIHRSPRYCISCGKEILRDSVFCEHCGATQLESQH